MAHTYIDPFSGKTKSSSYHNARKKKRRLIRIIEVEKASNYISGIGWSDYEFDLEQPWLKMKPTPNAYPQQRWRGKESKYLKKLSHRIARRKPLEELSGKTYHKVFDFWWTLY